MRRLNLILMACLFLFGSAFSASAQRSLSGNWEWKSHMNSKKEQTVVWVKVKQRGNKVTGNYAFAQLVGGENDGSDSSFVPFAGTTNGDTVTIEFNPDDIHGIEENEDSVHYKRPRKGAPSIATLRLKNGKLEWTLTKGSLDAGDLSVPRQMTLSRLK